VTTYLPPAQFGFFPLFNLVVRTNDPLDVTTAMICEKL
jgi:hypothetical protein